MSDQIPQPDPSEVSAPETQRYEPLPEQRLRWTSSAGAGLGYGDGSTTPERWFEPVTDASGTLPDRHERSAMPSIRGVAAVIIVTSVIAAALGAGGSYIALRASGALDDHSSSTAGVTSDVTVESDSSTVVAAVDKVSPSVVQIVSDDGAGTTAVGSGIIYDARGWVLTNRHVVAGAKTITVRLPDDRRMAGTVYGLDTLTDLAIVKITAADILSAPIGDSSTIQVGQMAIAIGSPLGVTYPTSSTEGIVSALGRDISVPGDAGGSTGTITNLHGLIQTDAAINPGNSGGPLIDASGRVVGVTTATAVSATGIGFAIPINIAKPIMQQALAGEKLSRPFIGVSYDVVDRGLAEQFNLPLDHGAWVHKQDAAGNSIAAVAVGSPGDTAGIKTGDIITSVEGRNIDQLDRLEDLLVQYAPGRTISLEVYRGGTYLSIRVTLGTRPDNVT